MATQSISLPIVPVLRIPLLLLALLVSIGSASAAPSGVGPNQQAAIDNCRATHREQIRTCRPGTGYAPCMTMYDDKLSSCLADANTVIGLDSGGSSSSPKNRLPKVNPPPKTSQ